jgi:undecaprenyl-diphosphatase
MNLRPEEVLSTSIYLHIGTALAATLFYRNDVLNILMRRGEDGKTLFNFLLISTTMTGLIGLPLYSLTESMVKVGEFLILLIGLALILTAIIQKQSRKDGERKPPKEIRQAVVLGCIQGFSAIPGLSRSGLTTSYLLLNKTKPEDAFKLSFLMSIPASLAASIGLTIVKGSVAFDNYTIISIFTALIFGLISLRIILMLSKRLQFWKLCVVLGIIILLFNLPSLI